MKTPTEELADCRENRCDAALRLSEATALLERCSDEFCFDEFDDPAQRALEHDVKAFLSRSSAQPAEPQCPYCVPHLCPEHQPLKPPEPTLLERTEEAIMHLESAERYCDKDMAPNAGHDVSEALTVLRSARGAR